MGIRDFLYATLIGDMLGISNPEDKYVGERIGSKYHGKGTLTYEDGAIYCGDWKNGKRDGEGVFKFEYGAIYEGEWRDGRMNGVGIFTWGEGPFEGNKYEGEWRYGKMHGKGTLTRRNLKSDLSWSGLSEPPSSWTEHSEGINLKEIKIHPYIINESDNWSKYIGQWEGNLMHGRGKLIYPNGDDVNYLFEDGVFIDEDNGEESEYF